jgi:hypothetical protein
MNKLRMVRDFAFCVLTHTPVFESKSHNAKFSSRKSKKICGQSYRRGLIEDKRVPSASASAAQHDSSSPVTQTKRA